MSVIIKLGEEKLYKIEERDEETAWISNELGEGRSFSKKDVYNLIDKLFKENF
jgi:hypothetical protein